MYITVCYDPDDPAADVAYPSLIDGAVDHEIDALGYVNTWRPLEPTRVVLANVPKGTDGATLHAALQSTLRTLPIRFVATRSDTGAVIARSTPEPPKSKTDATTDFNS